MHALTQLCSSWLSGTLRDLHNETGVGIGQPRTVGPGLRPQGLDRQTSEPAQSVQPGVLGGLHPEPAEAVPVEGDLDPPAGVDVDAVPFEQVDEHRVLGDVVEGQLHGGAVGRQAVDGEARDNGS